MSLPDIIDVNERHDFNKTLNLRHLMLKPICFKTLWVNITHVCNQSCRHCHVSASPNRTEYMERKTIDRCLEILDQHSQCEIIDITGGAPELHPDFNYLVVQSRKLNKHVVVRHNLTVTVDGNPKTGESMAYLPHFFAANGVEVLASLAHVDQKRTDIVRGLQVFEKSIYGIRLLNELGYGKANSGLTLDLVYNHDGPLTLRGRMAIEAEFRQELASRYGLCFNRLFTVINMPINRYYLYLKRSNKYEEYLDQLASAFSEGAAKTVACRSLISVGYNGTLYDCDFNQMLGMPINSDQTTTVYNFDLKTILNRRIKFAAHCFGCTSGYSS
jgi:radical SAM/Cys-rich protein